MIIFKAFHGLENFYIKFKDFPYFSRISTNPEKTVKGKEFRNVLVFEPECRVYNFCTSNSLFGHLSFNNYWMDLSITISEITEIKFNASCAPLIQTWNAHQPKDLPFHVPGWKKWLISGNLVQCLRHSRRMKSSQRIIFDSIRLTGTIGKPMSRKRGSARSITLRPSL